MFYLIWFAVCRIGSGLADEIKKAPSFSGLWLLKSDFNTSIGLGFRRNKMQETLGNEFVIYHPNQSAGDGADKGVAVQIPYPRPNGSHHSTEQPFVGVDK